MALTALVCFLSRSPASVADIASIFGVWLTITVMVKLNKSGGEDRPPEDSDDRVAEEGAALALEGTVEQSKPIIFGDTDSQIVHSRDDHPR